VLAPLAAKEETLAHRSWQQQRHGEAAQHNMRHLAVSSAILAASLFLLAAVFPAARAQEETGE
jgi:hypothetical protein